jgi:hypothetical protein
LGHIIATTALVHAVVTIILDHNVVKVDLDPTATVFLGHIIAAVSMDTIVPFISLGFPVNIIARDVS